MSLGVSRYGRALPLQNVSRGLFLIPRGFLSLAGSPSPSPSHSHQLSLSHRPTSPCSRSRCLLRPSLLARRLTHTSDPRPETAVENGETPRTLTERLALVPVRHHPPRESVLIKAATVYPIRRATIAEQNKRYLAKKHHELSKPRGPDDWRYILRLLSDYTPDYSATQVENKTVDLVVPPEAKHLLEPKGRDIIQLVADRSGCQAVIHEAEDSTGTDRISLIGFHTSVEEAIDGILKLDGRVRVAPGGMGTVQASEEERADSSRRIFTLHHRPIFPGPLYNLLFRADKIPRPSTWTETSFHNYVRTLVKGRMRTHWVSRLYKRGGSHELAVITILLDLFSDPSMWNLITPRAFHMALDYMTSLTHNTVWARRLLHSMHSRGFEIDLPTMHLLLEATTKDKSLADFHIILEQMIRRQLSPTLWTWIAFLRHIQAEDVKRYVLYLMDKKGLLDVPGAQRYVALEMAPHDGYRCALLGMDATTFLAKQTELYGPAWEATDTCNKIIHELLLQDRKDVAVGVLLGCAPRIKGDEVTLNTFLTYALRKRDMRIALSTLQLFHNQNWPLDFPLDLTLSYELLMKVALETRCPHTLSVIWRYANISGESTEWMRRRVYSLLRNLPAHSRLRKREYPLKAVFGWMMGNKTDPRADNEMYPPKSPSAPADEDNTPHPSALRAFVNALFLDDRHRDPVFFATPARAAAFAEEPVEAFAPWDEHFQALAGWIKSHGDTVDVITPRHPLVVKIEEAYERDMELRRAVIEGRPLDPELLSLVEVEVLKKKV